MMRFLLAITAALFFVQNSAAWAQSDDEVVWVQIEAQPSLASATDRARAYGTLLEDVNGFALGGGWYAIAVGPYRRADAEVVLRSYLRDGLIPRDSFIQFSTSFRQQFWPVGANVLDRGVIEPPAQTTPEPTAPEPTAPGAAPEPAPESAPEPLAEAEPAPAPEPADETPTEARRSEQQLSRQEKMDLQIALKWAGVYSAGIDGSFGRGTRNSMAAWQEANGYDKTGILTTKQRAALFAQYNAVLDGLGLQLVTDAAAGITLKIPTQIVTRTQEEPPFVHYEATGEIAQARLLLISQPGDQDTLFGLYEIMQTLAIVPLNGPRSRKNDSFELTGENSAFISHTEASLKNGHIKGFTLIWPKGDEERRTRLLSEMQASFDLLPAVLDPAAGNSEDQSVDLVSGLQIRLPKLSRSGFFIDAKGTVATTSDAVQSCTRITLDQDTEATVIADDAATGLALLRPKTALAPLSVARFSAAAPRLQSEIAVAGFPYEGVLGAASVTFGKLADLRGLQGEENLARLDLGAQPGDAGGPVMDASGNVMGMLLPRAEGAQQLPEKVSFALDRNALISAAAQAGVNVAASDGSEGGLAPVELTAQAMGMTVLVSCWE
ncbi:MAG: trypsin-like peptidase domain-containing protein [Sulfitobacter sp.]